MTSTKVYEGVDYQCQWYWTT